MSAKPGYVDGEKLKDFQFRRILPSDYQNVLDHLSSNFFRDEATCQLFGWSEGFVGNMWQVIELVLQDGISFMAEHIPTGEVASLWIIQNHTSSSSLDTVPITDPTAKLYVKCVCDMDIRADLDSKLSAWADFYMVSTSRKFRNLGLAGELCSLALTYLKEQGFQHAVVVGSSSYTRQLALKRGFLPVLRMEFSEFMRFDNTPVFKAEDLTPEHYSVLMLQSL